MCPGISIKSSVSNIPFGRRQTPLDLGMAGPASEPMISELARIAPMVALLCQAQEELLARSKICWAPKYLLSEHTWVIIQLGATLRYKVAT